MQAAFVVICRRRSSASANSLRRMAEEAKAENQQLKVELFQFALLLHLQLI